ncbi:ABC transporter ATP-binding protein [Oceanirhabdus sp. W0125-5]|nr:ABC transporter ATP-binding protein [Oceanirhabdus sp. W0125-5]WBW99693.1 ABC transporter ATP-binding protein [Oceanirhabdus sp. W0125-5]
MIDGIVYYENIDMFLQVSLVYVVMSIFSCILYFFIYTQHQYLMNRYTFDIRLDIFKKIQSMKSSYMSSAKTGDLISLLISDTAECMHFVIRNVIHLVNNTLMGVFYIIYIYIVSIPAGIVVTLFLPFAAYSTFKFNNKIRRHTDKQRELYGGYVSWLFEILKGLTDIRLLCAQKIIRKDFTNHLRNLFSVNIKTSVTNLSCEKIIEFINLLIQLSIYGVCAYLAYNNKITIGSIMVLLSFVFTLKDRTILGIVRNLMDAQSRLTRISRINNFLCEDDETSWQRNQRLVVTNGTIQFKNIEFSYDKKNTILKDFNAIIPSCSSVALVGESGCGKSTLISLLIALYEADRGTMLIDNQNINDCSLKSIRDNIGVVQQDILTFDATIRENLLLGNFKATDDELWNACRKAGIHEYIENLPEKLDTLIGKKGLGLSGGQRQRLAIARIYLKDPAIIVFDEATSALDKDTEKIIHKAWKELLKGRTSILIAHRLNSVMLCDNVILLENGKVKISGNPKDLIEKNNSFRKLFSIKEVSGVA